MAVPGPIQAVVFDWDGTLMDSKAALLTSYHEATQQVLGRAFPVEPHDVDEIIQLRAAEAFPLITGGDRELTARLAEAFQDRYKANQDKADPFPGTLETIAELRSRGIKIGVATSKAKIRMDLEGTRTGLVDLVDFAVCGDEVRAAKPDPEAVVTAIAALGVMPARTLYVGDGANDVVAGRGAGAITVGVSYGFHPEDMLRARPNHVIDAPAELLILAEVRAPA